MRRRVGAVGAIAVALTMVLVLVAPPAAAEAPGTLDTSFDGDGKVVTPIGASHDEAHALAVSPDGGIIVAGFSESGTGRHFAVTRYRADGNLDESFDGDGKATLPRIGSGSRDEAYALALQPDGKIVLAGDGWGADGFPHFAVARLNVDGSLDDTFDGDGLVATPFGAKAALRAVAVQSDGKILVAGNAATDTGSGGWGALIRYNPDGSLDTTFNDDERVGGVPTPPGIVVTDVGSSSVYFAIAVGADGGIVATGRTRTDNFEMLVVRYVSSGSRDASFGPVGTTQAGVVITSVSTGTDSAQALAVLDDGRIITAGFAQTSDFQFQFAVVRYLQNGGLDPLFDSDGIVTTRIGSLSQAFGVALDQDGRAVVAGEGTAGTSRDFALARYDANGALDTGFGTGGIVTTPFGTAIDSGRAIRLQPDGGILVAGNTDSGGFAQGDFALARYHGAQPPPPPDRVLNATTTGTGSGTVTSAPPGIDCGTDCSETYPNGTIVELAATPLDGSAFTGWSGDCSGTGACQVSLDTDRTVTATFDDIPVPAVLATSPTDGATGVAVDAPVTATFDAQLHTFAMTLTSDRGRAVDGVVSCDSPCMTVTFTPERALAGRTSYTALVRGRGAGGASNTHTWTFTTGRRGGKAG